MCGSKDGKRKVVKANAIKHINWKEKLISSMTLDSRKRMYKNQIGHTTNDFQKQTHTHTHSHQHLPKTTKMSSSLETNL